MAQMTETAGGRWLLPLVVGSGTNKITPGTNAQVTLSTQNKFIDKDIDINIQADAATITTSSTNDGMSTYFNTGTSSDKNVTITPKYTTTAGYSTALTTATNNGGVTYWKIKTASPVFDGGTLSGNSTATGTNVTLSSTDNGIKIQTAYTAASTAVLYNGAVNGWVSKTDNTQALAAQSKASTNGTTYYVTAVTVPKDKSFSVTTVEDTALDTTSDLDITNAAYRRVDITNAANGTVLVSNAGNITSTQTAKTGTIKINAYDTSSATSLAGEKTIIENGVWKTTTISAANTAYYGRVTAAAGAYSASVSAHTITNPVVAGKLSGTITNIGTTTKPSGTDGTDYWTITPGSEVSTAGSSVATGKATIGTAGYLATGNKTSDDTKSISATTNNGTARYLTKAVIAGSSTNATATTTVAPGTVSIAKNTTAVSGKTRLDIAPVTATTNISTFYVAVQATAAANNTGTTSDITGTVSAIVATAGYAPATLTGSGNVSGTATAKTSAKNSSVYYIPITSGSLANSLPSGKTNDDYTDLSNTGPELVAGGYLYINEGYFANSRISLDRLIPGTASAGLAANHILEGYSAYNSVGTLITGTISTYDGTYTFST